LSTSDKFWKQIIGAPAFFPTVWGWIKKWFDPITTSKIFILSHHDMKKTLESFIDPKNIPKKYGGELEFHFGDQPVLDPHIASVLKWEGDKKEFPGGPIYWVNKTKDGKEIEGLAVGSAGGKERRENICTVTKALKDDEDLKGTNGYVEKHRYVDRLRPELLRAPTAAPSEVDVPVQSEKSQVDAKYPPAEEDTPVVVQEGELVPATRPEPVKFHTAAEGLETLSLNEKSGNLSNGTANGNRPHGTHTANLLDTKIKFDGVTNGSEEAHKHHDATNTTDAAVSGGVEEADSAHP
jgi:hypothetical protein